MLYKSNWIYIAKKKKKHEISGSKDSKPFPNLLTTQGPHVSRDQLQLRGAKKLLGDVLRGRKFHGEILNLKGKMGVSPDFTKQNGGSS